MKNMNIARLATLITMPVFAEPIAYQCAPVAMTNAEWTVTYDYKTKDGLFAGSNTLVIGPIDMAAHSVVPAHMESHVQPNSMISSFFFATFTPTTGLKLEWRIGGATGGSTNTCIIAPGVNTNDTIGAISYSLRWNRIVEQEGQLTVAPESPEADL